VTRVRVNEVLKWGRQYERLTCPGCQRTISAYVPHRGDGSGLRVVPHIRPATATAPGGPCDIGGRIVVRASGQWRLDL